FSVYLPLLTAREWETRLYAPVLLRCLIEDYPAIRPVAVAAFEKETHPYCRACTLILMAITGEPIRPRWEAGLKNDPSALIRVVAASRLVRQEGESTPQDVIDTLMNAMTAPAPQLLEDYRQVPTQGNITADLGAALSFAGPVIIERVIDALIADLQKGPDGGLQRIDLMLQLTCLLARRVPFGDPKSLTPLQQRVARECRRQLGLNLVPGMKMSGFVNYLNELDGFDLPRTEKTFDEYLAKMPAE
ncbi:MAG: hypothetical protein L0241_21415, partial [Planctomycetia bacterium]|nr:hypothetical protein [Planctomycetia bacterium]